MRKLAATLCLTLAVLLGSVSISTSGALKRGLSAYKSGNYATALREWTPLAKRGNKVAQNNLGVMYRKGKGVPRDHKTAVQWFKLAAKQGFARAQLHLGDMYSKGQGVPQDHKTAVNWYRLAAEQGHAKSQSILGWMYAQGYGVVKDKVYAHMWFNIAVSNGQKDVLKNRNAVAKELTPADFAAAQKLARECVRKNYKGC